MAAAYVTNLKAEDQLRHRIAWALAELLVVTQNQVS